MSGKTSRRKGHDYERAIRKEFRQLGWKYCETSRYASKAIDDAKIDLVKTDPFVIQCKSTANNPSYHKILDQMKPSMPMFKLIYHKRKGGREYVIMGKNDWLEILEMLVSNQIIKPY
jgi:Holliday junction resolvase